MAVDDRVVEDSVKSVVIVTGSVVVVAVVLVLIVTVRGIEMVGGGQSVVVTELPVGTDTVRGVFFTMTYFHESVAN